jgi:hypothetical protein
MNITNVNLPTKFFKISESIAINFYDNGFMLELSGQDEKDKWISAKIIVASSSDLYSILDQAFVLPRC